MKKIIPLTILILVGTQALAQDQIKPNLDQPISVVVELVDGEQIKGFIHFPAETPKLYIKSSNQTHILEYGNIANITFLRAQSLDGGDPSRFFNVTEMGIILGRNDQDQVSGNFTIHTINGFMVKEYLGAGVGIGLDFYDQATVLPFYLSVRASIPQKNIRPFYFVNAGYSHAWENANQNFDNIDKVRGGWMLHPGLGFEFKLEKTSLLLTAGYKVQKLTTWFGPIFGVETKEDRTIRKVAISIGITF